jgi:ABC-type multidrug transport system fused ATPase/permease subunit
VSSRSLPFRLDASDAGVEVAARAAEIQDEVRSMPDGYDTAVASGEAEGG